MLRRRGYNQSNAHLILKKEAVKYLRDNGYVAFTEYRVKIDGKLYIVDVVGIKDGRKVAIECGRTTIEKIATLKKVFNEVKRYNYTSSIHPKKKIMLPSHYYVEKFVDKLVMEVKKVWASGRVQIPKEVRDILKITDGDRVYFIQNGTNRIFLEKVPTLKKQGKSKYV